MEKCVRGTGNTVAWIIYISMLCLSGDCRVSGQVISHIDTTNYDQRIRPNSNGPPVDVRLNLYIESMGTLKESTMDFTLTMFFREFWQDPRLEFNDTSSKNVVNFKGDRMNSIWTPDVFFLYEKASTFHDVTVDNRMVRLYPNGSVLMSSRISVTLSCNMDLYKFPMDTQECQVIMMSYAYNSDEMTLNITDASLEIDKDLMIPKFSLQYFETAITHIAYGLTGDYSVAKVTFFFSRHLESYILTVYIPSSLIVAIAWLSFWIDAKAAPARVSLGITTVLTVTTMTAGIQETMPLVTYAKAIDVWLAVCLIFVFFSLLEYAGANYLIIMENKRRLKNYTKKLGNGIDERIDHMRIFECHYNLGSIRRPGYREPLTADSLDKFFRYSFPLMFIIFNVIYWPFYLR